MEPFLTSTLAVALAEIGDKTQLLTLLLIARYPKPWAIGFGILVATLVNHGLSAWIGEWLAGFIPATWLPWILGLGFVVLGLWILKPDTEDDETSSYANWGAFAVTLLLFFLAEIGDKTQVATIVLAAKYQVFYSIVAGTTLGMLIANVPVLLFGKKILSYVSPELTRKVSCGLFVVIGVVTILLGTMNGMSFMY